MSLKTIDGTFFQGKADGGINSEVVDVDGTDWEVQECMNSDGKVYYKLWILWNNIDTRDYYTQIRKQNFLTPVNPTTAYTKPFTQE